jgi:hypothetical protein
LFDVESYIRRVIIATGLIPATHNTPSFMAAQGARFTESNRIAGMVLILLVMNVEFLRDGVAFLVPGVYARAINADNDRFVHLVARNRSVKCSRCVCCVFHTSL